MDSTICFPSWVVVVVLAAVFYSAGWLVGRFPKRGG